MNSLAFVKCAVPESFGPKSLWGRAVFLGLLAGSTLPIPGQTQQTGNLLGRVTETEDGSALANAIVSVPDASVQIMTGDEGWYFLTGVPVGTHEVRVHRFGFLEAVDTVELGPDSTIVKDFRLRPDPVLVDGLVVTAEAEPIGRLAHRRVIRSEDIARTQATTVTQLLQGLVPGLTQTVTSGDVGAAPTLRIRGIRSMEATPPLFFLDGVRVGSARFRGPAGTGTILTFLDNINPRDLDRVEVLNATEATTLFGTDAAGGAILIYTKR